MFRRQRMLDLLRQNLSEPVVIDVLDTVQGNEPSPTSGEETGPRS